MILVTGGAGFIGSNIIAGLADAGHEIALSDRFGSGDKWRNLGKHPIRTFIDPDDLIAWLGASADEISHVIHMGAISSTVETDVDLIIRSNFSLSNELWEICSERRIPLIYASSAATYGDGDQGFDDDGSTRALSRLRPLNPYGWSKHLFDRRVARAVEEGRLKPPFWVGLKFFNVYGPNEYHKEGQRSVAHQLFEVARAGRPARLFQSHRQGVPDGEQKRDFVHVDDCVSVVLWLMESRASGLFNLGTGQARSFLDLAKAVFAALDKEPKIEFVPTPESLRERYQYFTEARMDRLRKAGYSKPFLSLEEGVRDYVQRYLSSDDPYR